MFEPPMFEDAPWTVELQQGGNGGLRNAIKRAHVEGRIKDKMWIGTLGMPSDALSDRKKSEIENKMLLGYDCKPVFVKDTTFEGHYSHYCKQILWPTMHYQTPDNPKSKAYEDHSWVHYKSLNQAFADKIVENYKEGDIVWVNDYHLMLVSEMVRKKLPNAKIGFFLHVAFPSSEVFRCLAARKEFLEGMLGANCVGFQISEYSRHFLQTCNRILAVDTTAEGIKTEAKFVSVVHCAIGIDRPSLDVWLQYEGVIRWRKMIRDRWPNMKLIVGRDKLDHIRGVKQKLLGYEIFLRTHPEWIDKAVLVQVGMYDVSDPQLESEVYAIIDRINSLRADLAATQPVLFLQQSIDFEQYLALLAEAEVFSVTSLREGMNLTCHEFVYCNERHGPLILSEFTGSAAVLGNESLLVNPWDKNELADTFLLALTMDSSERERRWRSLYSYVVGNTCGEWVEKFVDHVQVSWDEDQKRRLGNRTRLDVAKFLQQYQSVESDCRRIFFLNLDVVDAAHNRSLATRKTAAAYVSPQRKISVLNELVSDPANIVYVISRESMTSLERTFRRVSNIGLIAEGGGFLKPHGKDEWVSFDEKPREWHHLVEPVLQVMSERISGSRIEVHACHIDFDVTPVIRQDPERSSSIIGEFINHINDSFEDDHVHARLAEDGKVIIARDDLNDAFAVRHAYELEKHHTPAIEFLFVASPGSEASSEPYDTLYDWANKHETDIGTVCTVSVGSHATLAKWTLEGINGLLNVLLTASLARLSGLL
jgi:trehalose-6-phosphate synthase/trehalose-6-phosphatase